MTVNELELVKKYAAEAQGHNEVWLNYQDDQPPLRAKHPGDPRAALTPWLAHQVYPPPQYHTGMIDDNMFLFQLNFVSLNYVCIHVYKVAGRTSCTKAAGTIIPATLTC